MRLKHTAAPCKQSTKQVARRQGDTKLSYHLAHLCPSADTTVQRLHRLPQHTMMHLSSHHGGGHLHPPSHIYLAMLFADSDYAWHTPPVESLHVTSKALTQAAYNSSLCEQDQQLLPPPGNTRPTPTPPIWLYMTGKQQPHHIIQQTRPTGNNSNSNSQHMGHFPFPSSSTGSCTSHNIP
jgi:hypothetical protein